MGKFGTQGTGRGQLSDPSGIATDMCGFILVTELSNSCVSKMVSSYRALD